MEKPSSAEVLTVGPVTLTRVGDGLCSRIVPETVGNNHLLMNVQGRRGHLVAVDVDTSLQARGQFLLQLAPGATGRQNFLLRL